MSLTNLITNMTPTQIVLSVTLAVVMLSSIALWFTSYRYLLFYFIFGMVFWVVIEGLRWAIQFGFDIPNNFAYIYALVVMIASIVGCLSWLNHLQNKQNNLEKLAQKNDSQPPQPRVDVGHRPMALDTDTNYHEHCVRHRSVSEIQH